MNFKNTLLFLLYFVLPCIYTVSAQYTSIDVYADSILTGAEQPHRYINLLLDKKVGVLTNQTGIVTTGKRNIHLVDFLLNKKIKVTKIFAPEHGFRGTSDAGEHVKNGVDVKTKLPIISLYGKNKKPTKKQFKNIELMVFDLQDVGVRFYTYISSLHYLMEACAENNIPLIVLDRPNPIGTTVDGPTLNKKYKSFVGMHSIPVLHGLTIGEYAQMINGEGWLKNKIKCDLTVISCDNYCKKLEYDLPVKPSPNLPNRQSILLYGSLCFFEGTNVSVGRGTDKQFQIYGSPYLRKQNFTFTPKPNQGAKYPKHSNKKCYGESLLNFKKKTNGLNLEWLIKAYDKSKNKNKFFNNFFYNLSGNKKLKKQIIDGCSQDIIKKSWKKDIQKFKERRKKYLIYDNE